MKLWHGEQNLAMWKAGGGFRTKMDGTMLDFYNMFDSNLDTYWLGELDENGAAMSKNQLDIYFPSPIKFDSIFLVTRPFGRQFIRDTYANLCLKIESVLIECTPADFAPDVKSKITLKPTSWKEATHITLEFQVKD